MITDLNLSHATTRSTMSRPLKRGRACMNCRCANFFAPRRLSLTRNSVPLRFLKIKCDGQKPICGPCRKHPKDDECEYSDGPARSRTKALEDTVSRLEARLHELEHPEDSTPAVTLHDPYMQYNSPQYNEQPRLTLSPTYASSKSLPNTPFQQLPRLLSPSNSSPGSQAFTPLSPYSPASSSAPLGGMHSHGSSPLGIFDSRGSIASSDSSASSLDYDHPVNGEFLLQTFLPHASEFGFFLDTKHFVQSAMQGILPEHATRPSQALLNAVYMWGAHLSDDPREERFKYRALQHAATDLRPSHPQSFLHTIQAEVLLSHYFFRNGSFLEARAHTATAVALALGGGLHQIRSIRKPAIPVIEITEMNANEIRLPAPADTVEEGERINGFWAVFTLQSNISVALLPAAHVCGVFEAGGMQIDTPWPLEIEEYKQGLLSDVQGDSTVRNFLSQPEVPGYQEHPSLIAMNVRACILLHRAVYLHGQWTPNVSQREAQSLTTAFDAVELLINHLRSQLPDLAQLDGRGSARTILLTRSMLNAATIKLHSIFMYQNPTSRQHCLAAARDMFRFGETSLQGLGYLNPMMGTLWMTACSVFFAELRQIRDWPTHTPSDEKEVYESLQDGLAALSAFARESLLMRKLLLAAY
ncbi:hypothetical protein B0H17DRAFT_385970 [Mycena rosella]|uniref:Zn(2)-C6 fungal-type domain-containing protein n=1 Tax=Mycena rosella TaxID=1033263 RepID=A0AAD7G463_MYCRO|nr:hypothetical protein B0H17DRAFT_385970 [Mycena rosella]